MVSHYLSFILPFPAILTGILVLRRTQILLFGKWQVASGRTRPENADCYCSLRGLDSYLAINKDLFDVPEGMFHFGTCNGSDFLGFQFVVIHRIPAAWSPSAESGHVFVMLRLPTLLNSKITGTTEDSLLFTGQQLVGGHNAVNFGSGCICAVNQPQRVVDTNVYLHAEEPLVALLDRVSFRITMAALVLGLTRYEKKHHGINNASLNAAPGHFYSSACSPF